MAVRYTDVDQMIFRRWDEVKALRASFDDLTSRMQDVVEDVLQRTITTLGEKGWSADSNRKTPSIWFWKPEWANRRNEPGICLEVYDFVPVEYGKSVEEHPWVSVMTDDFDRLRCRESSEDFGRALRAALPPEMLAKWSHAKANLSKTPLRRDYADVSELDRVGLVADPEALSTFVTARVEEAMELAPAIDKALRKMTRR